ncbi:MAG: hypothetical protein F9K32_01700 [Desulfobulbaceae bacterium]|nr:MAG: hypothetical protein F9K32_01700 [Desulfobulbaceae bacterium]
MTKAQGCGVYSEFMGNLSPSEAISAHLLNFSGRDTCIISKKFGQVVFEGFQLGLFSIILLLLLFQGVLRGVMSAHSV